MPGRRVIGIDQAPGKAGSILERYAEMQAQRILRVNVDNRDLEAKLRQRCRDIGGNRGFANAALRRAKKYQRQEVWPRDSRTGFMEYISAQRD
jgi:hypothetical protein